jgi:sodium-coupled monocarboxylate transporter 8/12
MPLYAMDTMGSIPGLTGLFVAGIFSSALSSVSPILNSLAAITVEDYIKVNRIMRTMRHKNLIIIIKIITLESEFLCRSLSHVQPFKAREMSDEYRVGCMKIMVLTYGSVCIVLAFLAKYFGSVYQGALTIFGVIGGPVSAVFTLGVLVPFVNQNVILFATGLRCVST